jgi:N-acyl-D-amino-acid deacylase
LDGPVTVLRGAVVVDGSGRPAVAMEVGISGDRITEVAPRVSGGPVVDLTGLVLAPGFVDMHAHSDLALLTAPDHLAKVSQGVTCEVIGQDGLSYAPVDDTTLPQIRQQIAGWNGDPAGFDWDWRTVGGYLDRLDSQGVAVNACYLVPHGNVRAVVLGWDARQPTPSEVDEMRALVAQGMRDGAFGMSGGLTYPPGMYADTAELVALCEVVAAHGGFFDVHHRSYGVGALDAYAEMVAVSEASGCPLHLAHATMNFPVNAGRAGELLDLLDETVTLDTYPYTAASTTLASLLPSWAAAGGPAATLDRLADPDTRERIRVDVEERGPDGNHGVPVRWDAIRVGASTRPDRVGGPVTSFDDFVDLLVADRLGTTIVFHVGHEENVRTIMRYPRHLVGSDGLLVGAKPHPRAWGTFPRYLGHYVRELGILTLEECVARMTARAAARLGLADRGLVRPGYAADLVAFDPATVADRASYDDPRQPAEGIPYVYVNGVAVIADSRPTGALPGRALRHRDPRTTGTGG